MSSDDRKEIVPLQKLTSSLISVLASISVSGDNWGDKYTREEERTSPNMVVYEAICSLLLSEIFGRVGPQNIAHETCCRWLPKPVNLNYSGPLFSI